MDIYQRSLKLTKTQIEILERLGLTDTEEVLQYYPFRYEYLDSKPFSLWQEKDKITFEAQVVKTATSFRKGRLTTS
ncbi:MAG: ATP-dependent DNA helicase RecG, partial [Solobacterium sp.]|nr:ATP-dependent DNA helicase RecG [Solobacterium sp.]